MIRKPLLRLAASLAVVFAPVIAQADPWYVSEGYYYGGSTPTAVQGRTYPAALDSSLNLQVNCVTGCSGSGGSSGSSYNPSATPLPTATIAPPAIDSYQETYVAPGPHASPFPVAPAAVARTGVNFTVAAGGTSQTLFTAGQIKNGCLYQNTSNNAEYITADGTAATTASFYLQPLIGVFNCSDGIPTANVNVLGATTGQTGRGEYW